ncbi:MAG: AraC family transcriptional regulator [Rikenellaceae bacterium]
MKNLETPKSNNERIVVKYTTSHNTGVEQTRLTRNAIGYVIKGDKYIHDDDRFIRVSTGDIFFLGQGSHYIENIPSSSDSFEQIVFYYTPSDLQHVIASLNSVDLTVTKKLASNAPSSNSNASSATPTKITRNFFLSTNSHFELGGFLHDTESERLKLTELAHLILKHEDEGIKQKLIQSLDQEMAEFERIIYNNIFEDKSVEELAKECGRSLTSFKKDFKNIFKTPPHQWYLRQKLNYAKLLVSTTSESIFQIGNICTFPNTSHFIKLFKRHYGYTPTTYRSLHKSNPEQFMHGNCGEMNEMRHLKHMATEKA